MRSSELFIAMPTALAEEILDDIHGIDKQIYKAVLDAVAQARKLRTVFLERQPRRQRHSMVVNTLMRKTSDGIADNLIRTWLLKKHTELLTVFLDALAIEHEKGMVDDVPEKVDDERLKQGVEKLLQGNRQDVVAIYLHAFHEMNEPRWENLGAILDSDSRLQFAVPSSAEEGEPASAEETPAG